MDSQTIVPIRILVRTKTHLVPGKDHLEKSLFIFDAMCSRHFNRNFDPGKDRTYTRGAWFGYPNRRCYFLVDHGQASNDDEVPIMWYEWTGDTLDRLQETLPEKLKDKLRKEYPFTRPSVQGLPKRPPPDDIQRRDIILRKLRCKMSLLDKEFEFIEEHPIHAKWLKDTIEPRFWLEFESLAAGRRHKAESTVSIAEDGD